MEWMVDYESDLAKEDQAIADTTGLAVVSPKAHKLLHLSKPLISGFHRPAQGSRVSDMAVVLVQEFRDVVWVSLIDPLNK